MVSPTFLLMIFSSLVFDGLCGASFSSQHEVKTIKTKHGVYDCVDFYKQPAFSHPSLKNQSSKVSKTLKVGFNGGCGEEGVGTTRLKEVIPNLVELQRQKVNGFGFKDDSCPIETVPILRINQNNDVNNPLPLYLHCVALAHTNNLKRKFNGVGGSLAIYKPNVQNNDQSSSTRLKLSNGNDSFEAGWMVNPKVFNDKEAHLYASFSAGGKSCINIQCPGFVQVATDIPLGISPPKYSTIGGLQVAWNLSIDKYPVKEKQLDMPKELFNELAHVADKVEWGGEVYSYGPGYPKVPAPEMGNGLLATTNAPYSAVIAHSTYVDENFKNVLNPEDIHMVLDCDPLYTVIDGGYDTDFHGRMIFYGGTHKAS
ncbi:uncharacterized protein LOC110690612 [Chenopodium quinoa]|uniref:uncharacterized protein LOC110690612 n=1 Tax=Chenopodium quinoa TaxID=63459 RepID=UPI000B773AE1|nr:uncharacterized protein LOC110690612 [Chenopodium quinoa]